jgi:polyribonucleotide nucleotidyltransferase
MTHKVSCEFAGRTLTFETGKLALQADAAVLATYGDTIVLVTACVSKDPVPVSFLPLRVDFEEKMYAVGRIPGGFFKREGKPSDETTIMGRSVDRPIRPLIPDGLRNDVQVIVNPLSVDTDCSVSVVSMIAASAALHISSIPFAGPFAAAQIGRVDGELTVNPPYAKFAEEGYNLLVAATSEGLVEIEMEGDQIPEDLVREGMQLAFDACQPVLAAIEELRSVAGKPKGEFKMWEPDAGIVEVAESQFGDRIRASVEVADKPERNTVVAGITAELMAALPEDLAAKKVDIEYVVEKIQKKRLQEIVINENRRVDGRRFDEVRPLSGEVGLLPRVHGTGLFTRGDTQVLTTTTLGAFRDQRMVRSLDEEQYSRFMHHYNFPPFSVGEVRGLRAAGRREIGHGALAGKALEQVLPPEEEFPYTVRLVSEVLGGDASTSMASACAGTLALMDAGVPIKAPVAGISAGLVLQDDSNYRVFADLQALEDFLGHMDFKVAGTAAGVNAIQVDTKLTHLPLAVCFEALDVARAARLEILEVMDSIIATPRDDLSEYAPRMYSVSIPTDKIGMVIGPGGKNVRKIQEDFEVQIDIQDTGTVLIFGVDSEKTSAARQVIADMTREITAGEVFTGRVTSTTPFGAFVELMPGREALVHISHLAWEHIGKTEDVARVGDQMQVKVIEVDDEGKVRASRKELLEKPEGYTPPAGGDRGGDRGGRPSGGRSSSGGRGGGGGSRGGSGGGRSEASGSGESDPSRPRTYFREKKRD